MDGDDAEGGGPVEGGGAGPGPLVDGEQGAGGGPDPVVVVGGDRVLAGQSGGGAQRGGAGRGVHVDAGQVDGPAGGGVVEFGGGGAAVGVGPVGVVPALTPDDGVVVGGGVVADQVEAFAQ